MDCNKSIGTTASTVSIIKKNDFRFKKKFGQNFLIDNNILDKIVEKSEISSDDLVIEIGPGIGALSEKLAEKCKNLILIEIDDTLIPILKDSVGKRENVEIIHNDVLKVDINEIVKGYEFKNVRVVANLPYYITTPILMKLLESQYDIDTITVMVQKEVADRLTAKEGEKDYGAITLAVRYHTDAKVVINVSPNCFMPKPKVHSAVVHMKVLKKESDILFERKLFAIIRATFNQRRKTMINAIGNAGLDFINKEKLRQIFSQLDIDDNIRGEKLSLEDFIQIVKRT